MKPETEQSQTCKDRWQSHCNSRLEDLRLMLAPERADVELIDDGTLDTVLRAGIDNEFRFSDTSAYRDEETGELDMDSLLDDEFDQIAESLYERFYEYGLEFSYQGGDDDSPIGPASYWRFLISWGGPSDELRFFTDQSGRVYRVEYWFLDWYDGHGQALEGEQLDIALLCWDALTGGETPQVPEEG